METTIPTNSVLPYSQRPRQKKRLNVRLIVFIAIAAAPFLLFVGLGLNYAMHQGIQKSGNLNLVDLKALGFFTFDQVNGTIDEVPKKWRALDGKKVQLEGFMYSGMSAGNQLSQFQFVYNIQKCCFNGPPLVQERVFARVPHGRSVPYYGDFCRVTGTLHVNVKRVEGVIVSIYTLDVDSAELVN